MAERIELAGPDEWAETGEQDTSFVDIAPGLASAFNNLDLAEGTINMGTEEFMKWKVSLNNKIVAGGTTDSFYHRHKELGK